MDEEELASRGVAQHRGFPNAAEGSFAKQLDLTHLLIKHPSSTFLMQLDSDEWSTAGMFAGDVIVVDRSLDAKKTSQVIWWDHDQFVISLKTKVPEGIPVWGVVSSVIHQIEK
jgi:SOS-response transcriptional repressor LexA